MSSVKGVGPRISAALGKRGVRTVEDLLFFLPVRYEDRREVVPIGEAKEGERAVLLGRVVTSGVIPFRRARGSGYETVMEDPTGVISLRWFRRARFLGEVGAAGDLLLVSGVVSRFGNRLQMVHPHVIRLDHEEEVDRYREIAPVYPEVEGIKSGTLSTLIRRAFADYEDKIRSLMPEELEKRHELIPLREACRALHFPPLTGQGSEGDRECRERLAMEEFFRFQAAAMLRSREAAGPTGLKLTVTVPLFEKVVRGLPFDLTLGQRRVIEEIGRDLGGDRPMNRLLQGDVGSGKTVVALLASAIALGNGYQAALMAPTEILAEQHYLTIHRFFERFGIPLLYLRGDMGKARAAAVAAIRVGSVSMVIGTHAMIEEDVVFKSLGLAIIDEQHRFGVLQRKALQGKGPMPHTLVMSATPIPRTLALTCYGGLDVSVIDDMPEGRRKVETMILPDSRRHRLYRLIEDELEKGHQAYMVYPMIEESENPDILSAERMARELIPRFPGRRIGLLHGRMKAEEKETVMTAFKAHEIDLLVCTTVIEVGIDVPDATLMVVEHAERFGLAQLHQLRGRVGRSTLPSLCVLVSGARKTEDSARRLKVMEETGDGFVIAEEDLKTRGPGEVLGVRQSGLPDFRVGDLVRDGELMVKARAIAEDAFEMWGNGDRDHAKAVIGERWSSDRNLSSVA